MRNKCAQELCHVFCDSCTEPQVEALKAAFAGADFVTLADFEVDVRRSLVDEAMFVVATFCGFQLQELPYRLQGVLFLHKEDPQKKMLLPGLQIGHALVNKSVYGACLICPKDVS